MAPLLFFNGCVLLVVGAFLGFPYWRALKRDPGSAQAWRIAHSAITAGAVGMLAIAGCFHLLKLPDWCAQIVVYGAITSGYGFACASTLSAITGHRGLGPSRS